jgi:hypothetical protein
MPATKVISRCSDTRGDFLIKLAPARCSVTSYFTARQAFRDVVKTTLLGLIGPKLGFWPSCGTLRERIDHHGFLA